MDQDTGNNRQHLQRDYARTKKEEKHNQNRSRPPGSTSTERAKYQRRFKRMITHNITNLSKYQLMPGEISVLSISSQLYPYTIQGTSSQTPTRHSTI